MAVFVTCIIVRIGTVTLTLVCRLYSTARTRYRAEIAELHDSFLSSLGKRLRISASAFKHKTKRLLLLSALHMRALT
ncbi:CLUMA_CG020453, isoform A [Clunio marinus]|uniref:CLUMA_CG020453, isoform A n=1 Tax=Clunio marinus TaxID=568069 RepID=A0A1J1J505_9DIPT|nr:CLUMA_CG020453, isoform A [Clunio marinus]